MPNKLCFIRKDATSYDAPCSAAALPTTTWTHIVATYNGTTMTLYVNGTAVSTGSTRSIPSHTTPLKVGLGVDGAGSHYFGGLIDEVAVYNSVLSAQQVTEHYDAGHM